MQGHRKLFYGGESWVKMSATMVGRRRKIWPKRRKAISYIKKFGPKYKWFKITYLEFFFLENISSIQLFISSTRSSRHYQSFFNFRFCSRKSQSQQNLAKKITHFTIQFGSKNSIILRATTLLALKIICSCNTAKNLSHFTNFSAKNISVLCHKKHLHCTISWCPRPEFLEHFQCKCLCISVYIRQKTFVPES